MLSPQLIHHSFLPKNCGVTALDGGVALQIKASVGRSLQLVGKVDFFDMALRFCQKKQPTWLGCHSCFVEEERCVRQFMDHGEGQRKIDGSGQITDTQRVWRYQAGVNAVE
jgi:hypothetical protein